MEAIPKMCTPHIKYISVTSVNFIGFLSIYGRYKPSVSKLITLSQSETHCISDKRNRSYCGTYCLYIMYQCSVRWHIFKKNPLSSIWVSSETGPIQIIINQICSAAVGVDSRVSNSFGSFGYEEARRQRKVIKVWVSAWLSYRVSLKPSILKSRLFIIS